MAKNKVRFCWECGNKLYGNHKDILSVDGHPRTLHKSCAKDIKKGFDYREMNGVYYSMMWVTTDIDWD